MNRENFFSEFQERAGSPHEPAMATESSWRSYPAKLSDGHVGPTHPMAARWTSLCPDEWSARAPEGYYTVALALRRTSLTLWAEGRIVHDGPVERGMIQLSMPGSATQCVTKGPSDFVHVYLPEQQITAHMAERAVEAGPDRLTTLQSFTRDPMTSRLAAALLHALEDRDLSYRVCVDGIVLAVVARLTSILSSRAQTAQESRIRVTALESWRVKRAVAYMDARIAEPITLSELGYAVGLSQMYFAARFRAATGISPHSCLLQRRVEHAKTLLSTTSMPVADIAFSVGFRTQAHFTTVFKRLVEETPNRWREGLARTIMQKHPVQMDRDGHLESLAIKCIG
jgi:AraC-like DNA-binding protein